MATEEITLAQISNGRVSLSMWIFDESSNSVLRYSGNDTFTQDDRCGVVIFNSATLTDESEGIAGVYFTGSIVFNSGSAEKSVNSGTIIPYE